MNNCILNPKYRKTQKKWRYAICDLSKLRKKYEYSNNFYKTAVEKAEAEVEKTTEEYLTLLPIKLDEKNI